MIVVIARSYGADQQLIFVSNIMPFRLLIVSADRASIVVNFIISKLASYDLCLSI